MSRRQKIADPYRFDRLAQADQIRALRAQVSSQMAELKAQRKQIDQLSDLVDRLDGGAIRQLGVAAYLAGVLEALSERDPELAALCVERGREQYDALQQTEGNPDRPPRVVRILLEADERAAAASGVRS